MLDRGKESECVLVVAEEGVEDYKIKYICRSEIGARKRFQEVKDKLIVEEERSAKRCRSSELRNLHEQAILELCKVEYPGRGAVVEHIKNAMYLPVVDVYELLD